MEYDDTLLHVYASSAVHSDCGVGFESARIIGLCMWFEPKQERKQFNLDGIRSEHLENNLE